jgi:hypothetical protein
MKITPEILASKFFWGEMRANLWGDNEDVAFNIHTNELFYHSCVDGNLKLYRRVKSVEDLEQALYDGFRIEL